MTHGSDTRDQREIAEIRLEIAEIRGSYGSPRRWDRAAGVRSPAPPHRVTQLTQLDGTETEPRNV